MSFLNKYNFKIKKGRHKANGIHFGISYGNTHNGWTFKLDKNCRYPKPEHTGVNKLVGFTLGLFPKIKQFKEEYSSVIKLPFGLCYIKAVHWNSLRVGFQPEFDIPDLTRIYAYMYQKGIREYFDIGTTRHDVKEHVFIYLKRHEVIYEYNNVEWPMEYEVTTKLGRKCYPYFGGQSPAVNNMNIFLKKW